MITIEFLKSALDFFLPLISVKEYAFKLPKSSNFSKLCSQDLVPIRIKSTAGPRSKVKANIDFSLFLLIKTRYVYKFDKTSEVANASQRAMNIRYKINIT